MALEKIYAQLSCGDLGRSVDWYRRLFGRVPDARPMRGLAEWHHAGAAGFQLFEDASKAGGGTMTFIVTNLDAERARLTGDGLEAPGIEPADASRLLQLRDPDGNRVVLAEPARR